MAFEICKNIVGTPQEYWDSEFFEQTIEYAKQDCEPIEIVKIKVEMGSNTGDNYLGCIYRVKVHFKHLNEKNCKIEEKSFIIKCIPNTDANKFLHDCKVFLKEKIFYADISPIMELLSNYQQKFAPK